MATNAVTPPGSLHFGAATVRERGLTVASTRNSPLPHGRGSTRFDYNRGMSGANTEKPGGKDGPIILGENALLGVSIGLVGISSSCVAIFFILLAMSLTNAILVTLGTVCGLIGSGVSLWFTLRIRRLSFSRFRFGRFYRSRFGLAIFFEVFNGRMRF